jgi:hypothetical protein
MKTKCLFSFSQIPPLYPTLNQLISVHTPTLCFIKMSFNIILPYMPPYFRWPRVSGALRFPKQNVPNIYSIRPVCWRSCPFILFQFLYLIVSGNILFKILSSLLNTLDCDEMDQLLVEYSAFVTYFRKIWMGQCISYLWASRELITRMKYRTTFLLNFFGTATVVVPWLNESHSEVCIDKLYRYRFVTGRKKFNRA